MRWTSPGVGAWSWSLAGEADRGRAVHSDHMLYVDYWVERNFCTEIDTSIQALSMQSHAMRMDLLGDRVLGPLHEQAVQWRHSRFRELMLQEPYRALLGRLMMTPPSRPVELGAARTLMRFATQAREDRKQ